MSRSGYTDDYDEDGTGGLWRGAVASALRGKRGQAFLRELAAALDAMPEKRLIAHELEADGEFCTIGVLGAARGIDMAKLDPEDYDQVAAAFGIAPCMAQEIVYENDEVNDGLEWRKWEVCGPMRPFWPHWEKHERSGYMPMADAEGVRWQRMRKWVAEHIKSGAVPSSQQEGK